MKKNLPAPPALRRGAFVHCALALALLTVGGPAGAAALPIYKCLDKTLGILYTDIPCKEGERLDVRAGDADPKAIARLDREREAWDRSAAQRLADDRRAMLEQRRYYNDAGPTYLIQEGGGGPGGYYDWPDYAYFGGYGYPYGYTNGAGNFDRRGHADGRNDGRHDGRFDRRRDRVVPANPRTPHAGR